jgi:hypothetical protein
MKRRAITFAIASFFLTSLALATDIWILDSSTSNARLCQDDTANPESSNTGETR